MKEFDRHLNEVSSKAEEKKQSLALLIDIDGFKDVNDHYSHQQRCCSQTNVSTKKLCPKPVQNI